jgi:hypothetical protein
VLVLHPQAQDPDSGIPRAGHPYSMPKNHPRLLRQTSRNTPWDATPRRSLSPASFKAGISRGEIR